MKNVCASIVLALLAAAPVAAQNAANSTQQSTPAAQAASQGTPVLPALPQLKFNPTGGDRETNRIAKEVRHELVMLPYYTIWDWLSFSVNGETVTLYGTAVNPSLKSDAENAVKRIEGVEKVNNQINIAPPFPDDERIREQVARSIFSFDGLSRYSWSAVPPIHIVVTRGNITLEGVVDSESDKNTAGIRANQVPGSFKVTNNLLVIKGAA